MIDSKAHLTDCPEDIDGIRSQLAEAITAMTESEIDEVFRLGIQRGLFLADDFPSARANQKGGGLKW